MQKTSKVFIMHEPVIIPYSTDNYAYLLHKDKTTFVIDPGEKAPIQKFLQDNQLALTHILLTHSHSDHVGGAIGLQKITSCAILGPKSQELPYLDPFLLGEEELIIGPYNFEVMTTPGHTAHDLCYYFPKEKWLFSGDTLFQAGCGKVISGTYEQLLHSLLRIYALPEETQVFPGHEYLLKNLEFALFLEPENKKLQTALLEAKQGKRIFPSTLQWEKEHNPFLRITEKSWEKRFSTSGLLSTFIAMRKLKDQFKGPL